MSFTFDNTFVRELDGLFVPWEAAHASAPELLALDAQLAAELGATADELRSPEGVAMLVGNTAPAGAEPVAMAYAGHQFGGYSPQLGDGRALLLGEIIDRSGRRRDIHLKGSGRTPFARGGDGRATVGPMLREYVISAAMFALGVPTTRSLAVVATGDDVARETMLPGAVLVRVAASHLRVGTFQFAAAQGDPALVRRLADYAIERHYPDAADEPNPYLALFDRVLDAQASLVARWMALGFIHGVMNTDNVTISGETIDYGPCAFMDVFDPATVFSSIDHGGRYAYGNQPMITQWNLARFAETLLALFDDGSGHRRRDGHGAPPAVPRSLPRALDGRDGGQARARRPAHRRRRPRHRSARSDGRAARRLLDVLPGTGVGRPRGSDVRGLGRALVGTARRDR